MEQTVEELRNEIRRRFDDLRNEKQKITVIREKARTEKEEAERQSLELDKRLPELLANIGLGRITKARGMKELVRIKREKIRLREIIEHYPFFDEGLRREEAKISHRGSKIAMAESKLNEYTKIKDQILANPHDRHSDIRESKLTRLATDPALNCSEDAETFLKNLKEAQAPKD